MKTEFEVLNDRAKNRLVAHNSRAGVPSQMDPVTSFLSPHLCLGVTSEKHEADLNKFLDDFEKDTGKRLNDESVDLLNLKFNAALAQYGEAVGCVAGMTLTNKQTKIQTYSKTIYKF